MENNSSILMGRYELGRLLGQGTFAKVYYARSIRTGQSVAIKVIDKDKVLRVGLVNQIKREISIMRLVKHPNILQLYEVMATKTKIYFVLEYAKGGELFDKVSKGRLTEDVARKYFQQLVNAVDFCHCRGVYHRDLKPENLLLDENENLKVSDFGLSALVESKRQDGLLHTTCGTPAYVAPEVIDRKGYDGAKADVWSCGVILYVLLAGFLPFHDSNLMEMYRKIGKADYRCPSWFTPPVRRLLSRILDPNPNTRISMAKIRENSWFKKGFDNISMKQDTQNKDMATSSSDNASDSCETSSSAATDNNSQELPTLNAFDIISLSPGFDLSRLFEGSSSPRTEARFGSWKPASVIISKLEEVAKRLKLRMTKRDAGLLRFQGTEEGRKGKLAIEAEIFQVTPAFHLIEMKLTNGDSLEYMKLLKDGFRPGLKGIIWSSWRREQQSLPVQDQDQGQEIPGQQLKTKCSQNQQVLENSLQPEVLP